MKLLLKHSQTQKLVTLNPSDTVFEAATEMALHMVGSVLVLDGEKLIGIFTERDLLNRVVAKGLEPKKTPLSEVMTKNVVTIDSNDTIESCYDRMQETRARHLPIKDGERVIGVVTMRNLLEWLWKEIEEENVHLKRYIQQS